jgi:hypothetical protein
MNEHPYELSIRTLVYAEDELFVAHALEMDILGYGESRETAVSELVKLLKNQITFAEAKGEKAMVFFPAPQDFFKRWESANEAQLKGVITKEKAITLNGKGMAFPMSGAGIRNAGDSGGIDKQLFSRMEGLEFAES